MAIRLLAVTFLLVVLAGFSAGAEPKPGEERPPPAEKNPKNLIVNGDFEKGAITPLGWQTIDGLSSFWVKDKDPTHGMVLKVDTDVLQSQAYQWWLKVADGAAPKDAPAKLPTTEPKYDTLAGLDGVWFWSDPVAIKPGKSYWLTVDAKVEPGGPDLFAWLVGYPEKPEVTFGADAGAVVEFIAKQKGTASPNQRGRKAFIHKYTYRGRLNLGRPTTWQTCARGQKPFQPTKLTPNVRFVRVLLYAYWPPGVAYFDNVKLIELDE